MSKVLMTWFVLLFGTGVSFAMPQRYPGLANGCNPVPGSENTWKAHYVTVAGVGQVTDEDCIPLPGEFFELEYGGPLAAFGFTDGFVRRWGCTRETPDEPGLMFPRGWGDYPMGHWAIVVDFEQDAEESDWTLAATGRDLKFTLKAKPGERTRAFFDQGMFRLPGNTRGMTLTCTSTNGVKGSVYAFKLVAYTIPVEFRKRFTIDSVPDYAGASVLLDPFGEIVVNGQVVDRAVRVRTTDQMRRLDITKYLRKGENTVGYRKNAACGWGSGRNFTGLMEFFTVDAVGKTTVYGSDATWEGKLANRAWAPVSSSGGVAGFSRTAGGFVYQDGPLPLHAGALRVAPHGTRWPVFDYDREVAFDVVWPKGVKGAQVEATVRDAFTGAVKGRGECVCGNRAGSDTLIFPGLATGAYEIDWLLRSGTETVDTQTTEMVVAGPVGGKAYPLEEMEGELRRRKRLVCTIHPAKTQYDICSSNFIGHTGSYVKLRPDCGKVVEECGVKMRETEASDGAYFAWHVPVGTLGNAHIVEVDYSDAREQVIRSAVLETFPVNFMNNGAPYRKANANATGSVRTGGRAPLTGKVQTMRYVFFPGSRALTVTFESGLGGKPAACAEMRIYEVEGGLPAWDAPKSDRVFMNHTERTLFGQWGAARHPSMGVGLLQDYRPRLWSAAFLATKNRLSQLKFEGHNAAIEGLFMYDNCFATRSGASKSVFDDMDLYYLIAKMYKHNGIKLFVGYEYTLAPSLWNKGFFDVSERDIWAGRKDSAFHVDRHGRPASLYWGSMGFDDTHPLIRESMRDLTAEICDRYRDCGIAGLYLVCGSGWLPGFVTPRGMNPNEVGFEDRSIAKFEAETGIRLGTGGTDPRRFQRRYELLTGEKYAQRWAEWRAAQVKESLLNVREAAAAGSEKWRVLFAALMSYKLANPFIARASTSMERDAYQHDLIRDLGFDVEFYTGANAIGLEYVPTFNYEREMGFADYGALVNDGSRRMIRAADAVYYMPIGLNERYDMADGIPEREWWWTRTNAIVFDTKYANGAAYSDFVDLVDQYTPNTMIHTWLDCNIATGHDAALREFLAGYYATPAGDGAPYEGVKGVTARVYGGQLQLVNNTPWRISEVPRAGMTPLSLPPYAVRVVGDPRPMVFRFDPEVEKDVFARLDALLADEYVLRRIRPDRLPRLLRAKEERDAYLAENAMRDWEVAIVLERAASATAGRPLQRRFEDMLKNIGVARVNCGATKDETDAKGRLWLKDQAYTGFGTYGSEFTAGCYDRGGIAIVGAGDETDLCYKTEAGGYDMLCYHLPVPNGVYTLKLHIANTWSDRPGPAAEISVNGRHQTLDPWGPPNPCKYGAHTAEWNGLTPDVNGEIAISITKCPILNGIEVVRE